MSNDYWCNNILTRSHISQFMSILMKAIKFHQNNHDMSIVFENNSICLQILIPAL